jgi:DNA invertase Pin-like site-specific DNA recombinase
MRAVLYLRKSTPGDRMQADSLEVQEQILRAFAKEREIEIVYVFRDSASGTTVHDRPEFMEMVRRITHRHNFEAVLVRDVSRFGRFLDPDESAYWSYLFELHGVNTVYVEEMFTDDMSPLAGLVKSARRVMAAEFSREKSRVISRSQERVTRLGFLRGGPPPFGMKRVMVTRAGEPIQDLKHGEWKSLSTHRTKLAPGEPADVAIVREIFRRYADGESIVDISEWLNAKCIKAARGGRWYCATVAAILRNPAYIGHAVFRRKQRPSIVTGSPSRPTIEQPGSYVPIVDLDIWNAVRARHDSATRQQSNQDLAADLRRAYETCGFLGKKMTAPLVTLASWATYRTRFKGMHDGALLTAYGDEVELLRESIVKLLTGCADVTQTGVWDYDVEGATRLRVTFAFKRLGQNGAYWRFHATDGVLTLGVGLHAPPLRIEACYLVRLRHGSRTVGFSCSRIGREAFHPVTGDPRHRFRCMIFGTKDAEKRFLEAARAQPLLVLSRLARELGWPKHVVGRMYHRLRRRGCRMPPLKHSYGRRLCVVCVRCGSKKVVRPNRALPLRSSLCLTCTRSKPINKVSIVCPKCGRELWVWPSVVKKLSNGVTTVCKMCRVKSGLSRDHGVKSGGVTLEVAPSYRRR